MRIHADNLTILDIYKAEAAAGMYGVLAEVTQHGSRTRNRAFEVHLTGTSRRRVNPGKGGGNRSDWNAATWDEWGMFLAALFEADDSMTIPHVYRDANRFHLATDGRYETLRQADQCPNHKWTHHPAGQECTKCGALYRRGMAV